MCPSSGADEIRVPIDVDAFGVGWDAVCCPVCDDIYQHAAAPVREFKDHDDYSSGWSGRGGLIAVPFWGECGSKWELCLGFHKGNTKLFARIITSCAPF